MTERGPGRVLFEFVRHWSRRTVSSDSVIAEHGRLVLVCDAVDRLVDRGESPTVNYVADEIGLDQSGASRLMRNATAAGYLVMASSPVDGRRRQATLTAAGRSMLTEAGSWQEQVFDELTENWSPRRRREFEQAMVDLMKRSYEL